VGIEIMTRKNIINVAVYAGVLIFSALFIVIGNMVCSTDTANNSSGTGYYLARVVSIGEIKDETVQMEDGKDTLSARTVNFIAKITTGSYKDSEISMQQKIDYIYSFQKKQVEENDYIVVSRIQDSDAGVTYWDFVDYNRIAYVIGLCVLFFVLILVIGRRKGISTLISLGITVLVIFMVFIPSVLSGYNIYLSTIVVSVFIILMSLLLINGADKKTLCAIMGNICGVAVAGVLAVVFSRLAGLTGVVDQDYIFMNFLDSGKKLDMNALVWGGVLIGSLGAVMDIAMSISSAMNELSENMHEKTFAKMVRSGMNIGRDAIGTMTNTLILAYIGGSLSTVLLLVSYKNSFIYLFNLEMIISEIMQGVIGSIGILITVPFTTLLGAYIYTRAPGKNAKKEKKD
jgi:uncharacterized membrane protein